jgi:prephenate dehydrogenase
MKVFVIGIGLGVRWYYIKGCIRNHLRIDTSEVHFTSSYCFGVIDAVETWKSCIWLTLYCISSSRWCSVSSASIRTLIGEETIVFEVGSTKAPICKVVALHPKKEEILYTSHCGNRVFRTFSSNSRIV